MSRYYFNLTSSRETVDDEGVELSDLDAARCHAVQKLAEVLCRSPGEYWKEEVYRITASDERRLTLFTVEVVSLDAAALPRRRM
jgi:DNA polymerase III delta prime subunit